MTYMNQRSLLFLIPVSLLAGCMVACETDSPLSHKQARSSSASPSQPTNASAKRAQVPQSSIAMTRETQTNQSTLSCSVGKYRAITQIDLPRKRVTRHNNVSPSVKPKDKKYVRHYVRRPAAPVQTAQMIHAFREKQQSYLSQYKRLLRTYRDRPAVLERTRIQLKRRLLGR